MTPEELPRLDLRTREGRMRAVGRAVSCSECTLPARARFVVLCMAFLAHERLPMDRANLTRCTTMSWRTTRKYLAMLAKACGEDPIEFIVDAVNGKRPVAEWYRALELHGGRDAA